MKKMQVLFLQVFTGALLFLSCKKEGVNLASSEPNQLPFANAGRDTVIVLPVDSVLLDGSASYDPDGQIIFYEWRKITGPASFQLINSTAAKTMVKNLIEGNYLFELKAADNVGSFTKDTVQISVLPPSPSDKEYNIDLTWYVEQDFDDFTLFHMYASLLNRPDLFDNPTRIISGVFVKQDSSNTWVKANLKSSADCVPPFSYLLDHVNLSIQSCKVDHNLAGKKVTVKLTFF